MRAIIDSFWTFSKNKTNETFKILPDTCVDMIFDLNQNQGFLCGVMSKYQLRKLGSGANIIGIRFKTENFASVSKVPLNETKNLRVELANILPTMEEDRIYSLSGMERLKDKIGFLENFIAKSFSRNNNGQDQLMFSISHQIRSAKGRLPIVHLAKANHIGLRQLERRFKNHCGLTLKEFSNVVRFNHAKKSIEAKQKNSLLEIAFDTGFYDHAHMTNEFKRLSGSCPNSFR